MITDVSPLKSILSDAEVFNDGDLVESKDQDQNGDVRLIQLADIGDGEYLDKSNRFMTSSRAKALRCTYLKPGDLLLARMPDPLGRCCIFPGDEKPCVTVVDVCIARPNTAELLTRWLMHCLNAPQTRHQIQAFSTGTTRKRISRSSLGKIGLSVPPLPEQKRIAEVLDRAEALRARRRAALVLLDELTQSIFLDMFGDPVVNPRGFDMRKIGEIATVVTGNTPSRNQPEHYGDYIEWIKSDNINGPQYHVTKAKEFLSESGAGVGRIVPKNSILITCIAGSPSCIGNAAMTDRQVAFNQQINAIVDATANPHFLYRQILVGKRLIQRVSSNGMKGIVSKGRLEGVELMIPPRSEQDAFVKRSHKIESLKRHGESALEGLDELFASLQSRAFKGELFDCSREPVAAGAD